MNVTISAFFNGTNHNTSQKNTLAYLLNAHVDENQQKAFVYKGCGEEFGMSGAVFGRGLDEQCQRLIHVVESEIKKGNTVTLNAYGLSRGAVAALMLAKQLGTVNPDLLKINLALIDPVPGNLITTSTYLDPLNLSLAKKTMDLSKCKTLDKVLVLYPCIPLPAYSFHAPLLAIYPEQAQVEEDVIAGCHAGAQFQNYHELARDLFFPTASFISFARVYKFLKDCGTHFKPFTFSKLIVDKTEILSSELDNQLDAILLHSYENQNALLGAGHEAIDREAHSVKAMSIQSKEQADYFNLHHQCLAGADKDKSAVRLTIEESQGSFARLKRAITNNLVIWQTLKWSIISLALASLIVFTGGVGVLPLIGGSIATAGFISVVVLAPLVATVAAGLWYGALKPLLEWAAHKIYYPGFEMREFQGVEVVLPPNESMPLLVNRFGLTQAGRSQRLELSEDPAYSQIIKHEKGRRVIHDTNLSVNREDGFTIP